MLAVLLFIAITSLAASALVSSQVTAARREREEQLIFAGTQIQRAINSYYTSAAPAGARRLPESLEALLNDDRFASPRQHLRRIYPDPMTGQPDWVLMKTDVGIVGVHSRSTDQPLKVADFPFGSQQLQGSQHYSDWVFMIPIVQ